MEPTVEQRKHRRHPVNFQGVYSSGSVQVREAVRVSRSIYSGGIRCFPYLCALIFPLDSPGVFEATLLDPKRARFERGPSQGAHSGSTGAMWVSCHSAPFFPLTSLKGAGRWGLNSRIGGATVSSWALCEHGGPSACLLVALDPRSSTPVQYLLLWLTPWLSDCFLSVDG